MNKTEAVADTQQATVTLSVKSWYRVHGALLQTSLLMVSRGGDLRTEEAQKLLDIAPEIAAAGGSELLDAAELEAREYLGMPTA